MAKLNEGFALPAHITATEGEANAVAALDPSAAAGLIARECGRSGLIGGVACRLS